LRDGANGLFDVVTRDRASGVERTIAPGWSAVAAGDAIYALLEEYPDKLTRIDASGIKPVATFPPTATPYVLATSPTAKRVAAIIADRESPPGLCVIELASGAVRCPKTPTLMNGGAAMSADGRYVFYGSRDGIHRLDLEGDADRLVVPDVRASGGLALSPDQQRLVYSDCRTYGAILAIGAGAKPELLVERGLVSHPAGGAGGRLAWLAAVSGGIELRVRVPGEPERALAKDTTSQLGRPAFDESGAHLAFSAGADPGGLRVVDVASGSIVEWTRDRNDRNPVFTRDGGLAFTRVGEGGIGTAMYLAEPGATPRPLAAGWTVQDVDRARDAVLISKARNIELVDLATGARTPWPLGDAAGFENGGARLAHDGSWLALLGGPSTSTFYKVDRAGKATVAYEVPEGQTAGPPGVLSDGRIVFRPEIWIGELHAIDSSTWTVP
jgi:hypothetical protein